VPAMTMFNTQARVAVPVVDESRGAGDVVNARRGRGGGA
jgi:hypothetical protein